ncbi:glutathione S-transferase [Meredithblackwellia eburnea MCA 4105]
MKLGNRRFLTFSVLFPFLLVTFYALKQTFFMLTASASEVILEYFPIRGRGEPVRYFLADLGIPYTEAGLDKFWETKEDLDQYPFKQVPALTIDGKKLVQGNAILEYLAIRASKNGNGDTFERYRVSSLMFAIEDVAAAYYGAVYAEVEDNSALLRSVATEQADRWFSQFEHLLKQSKAEYFFWDYPSYPEYHLLNLVAAIKQLRPKIFDDGKTPLLKAWFERFQARPAIAKYEASRPFATFNDNTSGDSPLVE